MKDFFFFTILFVSASPVSRIVPGEQQALNYWMLSFFIHYFSQIFKGLKLSLSCQLKNMNVFNSLKKVFFF